MSHYAPGSVSLEITRMIAEGDNVALQWTSRARTLDGDPYENHCIGVFTVRDGKITSVREYMDTHYAYRALHRRPRRLTPSVPAVVGGPAVSVVNAIRFPCGAHAGSAPSASTRSGTPRTPTVTTRHSSRSSSSPTGTSHSAAQHRARRNGDAQPLTGPGPCGGRTARSVAQPACSGFPQAAPPAGYGCPPSAVRW